MKRPIRRTPISHRALANLAALALRKAHAPYSRFRVGAALLTRRGTVYTGCNIEISSYSLTICAERTALFTAFANGERRFTAIAVVSDDPGFTPPCGACRQVMMDLAGNIDFVMMNRKKQLKTVKLKSLIPMPFTPAKLNRRNRRSSK